MLKRSFYFTLFFLGCCGETQAMLTVAVPGTEMKKVQSQQDLSAQTLPPRRLAMSDSGMLTGPLVDITGATLNGGLLAVKRASMAEKPAPVTMDDDAQEDASEADVAGKDVGPVKSPKLKQLILEAVVARQSAGEKKPVSETPSSTSSTTSTQADEYTEEEIIFPGYIKKIWVKKCRPVTSDNWYDSFCCGH